jgi:hypothetical protein
MLGAADVFAQGSTHPPSDNRPGWALAEHERCSSTIAALSLSGWTRASAPSPVPRPPGTNTRSLVGAVDERRAPAIARTACKDAVMMASGSTHRGLGVTAGLDAGLARELAARCEQLGYHSLWSNDEPAARGLDTLAQFAAATAEVELGVGGLPLQ